MNMNSISTQNISLSLSNNSHPAQQCKIQISEALNDPEWDNFVASVPFGHHVQTSLWGQIKSVLGYQAKRIIVRENEHIVAGGQLLMRRLLPFVSVGFMPKGPICFNQNPGFLEVFLGALQRVAQTDHLLLLAIQPVDEDAGLTKVLSDHKLQPSWLELTSSATILIDVSQEPDKILAQMKRQTRQNIRRSEREGITCREGREEDLTTFYALHLATSQRQGFRAFSEQYYRNMWRIFEPHGYIKLMIAEFKDEPVSALLLIPFGDSVVAKILGWSGAHPDLRPNDSVFWASILWARKHGYHYFDFEGIDRRCAIQVDQGLPLPVKAKDSYTFFKLGYGGKITIFPLAYDYVDNAAMRWVYQRVFSKPEQWSKFYESLDRIRRRYG